MSRADTVRFRHNQAILVAALVAFVSALPVATARWYLLPILLIPLVIGFWAWRAGTDANPRELRVRALAGQRRVPWSRIVELAGDGRGRAVARLDDGHELTLPAVRVTDLPRLVSASGRLGAEPGTDRSSGRPPETSEPGTDRSPGTDGGRQ